MLRDLPIKQRLTLGFGSVMALMAAILVIRVNASLRGSYDFYLYLLPLCIRRLREQRLNKIDSQYQSSLLLKQPYLRIGQFLIRGGIINPIYSLGPSLQIMAHRRSSLNYFFFFALSPFRAFVTKKIAWQDTFALCL